MASFIEMFPTYLIKFLLGNIASMISESVGKSLFVLSYVYKVFALRFLASDSVDNICGDTVDRTINILSWYQIILDNNLDFIWHPWIFNSVMPNPHRKRNGHFAPLCCDNCSSSPHLAGRPTLSFHFTTIFRKKSFLKVHYNKYCISTNSFNPLQWIVNY